MSLFAVSEMRLLMTIPLACKAQSHYMQLMLLMLWIDLPSLFCFSDCQSASRQPALLMALAHPMTIQIPTSLYDYSWNYRQMRRVDVSAFYQIVVHQ